MHKKVKAKVRLFVRSFWASVLFIVIALAVIVQLGRAAFPILNDYGSVVEAFVSHQVGADVTFVDLEADWRGLTPEISIHNLRVSQNNNAIFSAEHVELEWNLLATLSDWRLGLRKLRFKGLEVDFEQTPEGQWRIAGLPASTTTDQNTAGEPIIDDPVDIFVFGRRLELIDTRLGLTFRSGTQADITVPKINLENDNRFHRLVAELAVDGEQALKLVVEGNGDPRNENAFTAKGFMQSQGVSGEKIIDTLRQSGLLTEGSKLNDLMPEHGSLNLAVWFKGTLRQGVHILGRANLDDIAANENQSINWPQSIATEFRGYWQGEKGWQLTLSDASAEWDDFQTPNTPVLISGGINQPIEIRAADVDLAAWGDAIRHVNVLPEKVSKIFQTLSPYGVIRSAQITLTSAEQGYFTLLARVENGGVKPWAGVPGLTGVSGFVEANAFDGHIILDNTNGFSMDFPRVYNAPLEFDRAKGDVRWTIYAEEKWVGISSGHITLTGSDYIGRGHFNLRLPFKSRPGFEPEMTLSVGVNSASVKYHKAFVPKTLPESLYDWLDRAVVDGVGENIAFIYHGTLLGHSKLDRSIQFFAHVNDGELAFDKAWPSLKKVDAGLLVDDKKTHIFGLNADLLNNSLTQSRVSLEHYADNTYYLSIGGKASGSSRSLLNLLVHSPIKERLDDSIADWQITGEYHADLDLKVPLNNSHEQTQNIKITLRNNSLHLPQINLSFVELDGDLTYDDKSGLNGDLLRAKLWQQSVVGSIATSSYGEGRALNILFDADVAIEDLQRWTRRPELLFAEGITGVSGSVAFPFNADTAVIVEAQSDLGGVEFQLPAPFYKHKTDNLSLIYKYVRARALEDVPTKTDNWLSVGAQTQVHWTDEGSELKGLTIAFGDSVSDAVKPGVIQVLGDLFALDGLAWYDVLQLYTQRLTDSTNSEQASESTGGGQGAFPIEIDVQVQNLMLGQLALPQMNISGNKGDQHWFFEFGNKMVEGQSTIYFDEKPIDLNFKNIYLPSALPVPELDGQNNAVANTMLGTKEFYAQSVFSDVDLERLQPINFSVDDFKVGERSLGAWRFKFRPSYGGAIAYDLRANINGLKLEGNAGRGAELLWLKGNGLNRTHFSGVANAEDISGAILGLTGEKMLTSNTAHMDIQVEWPGAPDQIDIENIEGVVNLDISRGRFIRGATAGENPFLKLMGLLNFDTLARRLRLDFSDLRPEGMAYESIKGELLFANSLIEIEEPLRVDTPASQLQLVGTIYLASETIDAKLVATLPLAGNLTAAAALTGGIPVAVGVFVLGKIFKNQFNKASSLRYDINGAWAKPDVKFDRIFENTIEKSASAPAKDLGASNSN